MFVSPSASPSDFSALAAKLVSQGCHEQETCRLTRVRQATYDAACLQQPTPTADVGHAEFWCRSVAAQQQALQEQQRREEQDHDGHAVELGLDLHV